ncbi:MAG: VCBS repeat-containing protein [Geobacter sp.]|nr:VCBS repeat-containing protein [Geobacter sp.]
MLLVWLIAGVQPCEAAKVKAYVNKFSVSTTDNRDELKTTLQTLLMSRLNSDEIQAVDSPTDAEIQVWGSYFVFGTVFSIDALVKTSAGGFIDRVYVQGDSQNDLLPSVVLLAKHLRRSILKGNPALATKVSDAPLPTSVEKVVTDVQKKEAFSRVKTEKIKPVQVKNAGSKAEMPEPKDEQISPAEKTWTSQRLPESMTSMAIGRVLPDKGTEVFLTGERYLRYYLRTKNLQFITAVAFNPDEKILGVDVADLDHDQSQEVYVTVLKGGVPASQVYLLENNQFRKIADNIPYVLRSIALEGKERKIYAQKFDSSGQPSGEVLQLNKRGTDFIAEKPLQLPPLANVYNFNSFTSAKGKQLYVVSHPSGYLMVYSADNKLLWKSRDKFGGSEALLCQSDTKESSASLCSAYLPQRLQVSKSGEVYVVRNTGLTGSGMTRHYTKSSIVKFFWNGFALQERWRQEQSNSYLADFSFDEQAKELLLLEVEPITAALEDRGSAVVVKKISK